MKRDTVKTDTVNSIAVITSNQARLLHPLAEVVVQLVDCHAGSVLAMRGREGKGLLRTVCGKNTEGSWRGASHRGEQKRFNFYG